MATSSSVVVDYAQEWYTWVIGGVFLGIIICVAYFKILKPRWETRQAMRENGRKEEEERKGLLKSKSSNKNGVGNGEYGGIDLYSTDMIPETPNRRGYGIGYQYFHDKLQSFWKCISPKMNKNNELMNDKSDECVLASGNGNGIGNGNGNGNDVNNKDMSSGSLEGGENGLLLLNNENENQVMSSFDIKRENGSYESLDTMPFNESEIDKINKTSMVNEADYGSNDKNGNKKSDRLFQVKMEGHAPKKIPFIRVNMHKRMNSGRINKYKDYDSSSDSGVYTDDLNSDNERENNDYLSSSPNNDNLDDVEDSYECNESEHPYQQYL